MAIHRIYFGGLLVPDTSGNVYWQPSGILDTNDLAGQTQVLVFTDSGTKIGASCWVPIPANYVGTAKIGVVWKATATSGDVVWDFDYRAIALAETGDPSSYQEALTVTDTVAGTTNLLSEAEASATAANFAGEDQVLVTIARDGVSGSDTMAASAQLVEAYFEYADV